jgi:hypothetical protein
MWGKKSPAVEPAHVPTDEEFWAKRDAERNAQAQASKATKAGDDADCWDGYAPQTLTLTNDELAALYCYELSAYNDTVGYYADGIQRVSPLPRRK